MVASDRIVRILVIAGSDSSGGAGLLRDMQVLADHGALGACAITAVTAQTASQVSAAHPVPASLVGKQIECALADGVGAIKIGMLANGDIVQVVASALRDCPVPIVVDPVLRSSSGTDLLDAAGLTLLVDLLLPRANLVTPNLPEARAICCDKESTPQALAQAMAAKAGCPVLLKGGHGSGELAVDWLCTESRLTAIEGQRVAATMRGTGCALSTAIAVHLARGVDLLGACKLAKEYVAGKLQASRPDATV